MFFNSVVTNQYNDMPMYNDNDDVFYQNLELAPSATDHYQQLSRASTVSSDAYHRPGVPEAPTNNYHRPASSQNFNQFT